MHDILKSLREHAEHDLKEIIAKKDFSPTEWANIKNVLSSMCKIEELDKNIDDDGYSSGYPKMDMDMSMRRGRSVRTGRYISRDIGPDMRTSGHSIKDRMIDQIERLYDNAETEHERKELSKWIERIEMGE